MKYIGLLHALFFFAPWMVYWVLSGLGYRVGVIVSLSISTIYVFLQGRGRTHFSDLFNIAFFSAASIATQAVGTDLFVKHSGFIGYLALSLMAAVSIAVGSPYTLKVSKVDWPEAYWRERIFIEINNLVTGLWVLIFALNASVHLLLRHPHSTVLSNTLIAVGVAFSIVYPEKAPQRAVKRRYVEPYRRFDWRVEPKSEDEYDAIIVGAGVGGLTCGALLAKKGYRVLVLEQHHQVGGYCSSFTRRGFVFNTGVADVSGLWDNGPTRILLDKLGLNADDLFVKNRVGYIYKGTLIDVGPLDAFPAKLEELFPRERDAIRRFFDDARRAYVECYSDSRIYGAPLPPQLIARVHGVKRLVDYPREHPHFYEWMNKTFREKLDEYFVNDDLKALISSLISYLGTTPDKTPASSALTACISYYLYGGFFPKGGAQNFVENLREVIETNGGVVLTNHKVDRIVVEGGEVKGVVAKGGLIRSSIVVSNVNAKTTFLELVGKQHLDKGFVDYIESLKMSPSCFTVFLGVNLDLSNYPTLIKNMDRGYEVVINSNADPALAPKGMSSLTIMTSADYRDFPSRGTKEYGERKTQKAKELLRWVEEDLFPGISKHIVVMDAATPKTFERYALMPEGAIYAFDQSMGTERPYFKTPIKGLYLTGASTFPGGGVEAAIISGTICANDIHGWRRNRYG